MSEIALIFSNVEACFGLKHVSSCHRKSRWHQSSFKNELRFKSVMPFFPPRCWIHSNCAPKPANKCAQYLLNVFLFQQFIQNLGTWHPSKLLDQVNALICSFCLEAGRTLFVSPSSSSSVSQVPNFKTCSNEEVSWMPRPPVATMLQNTLTPTGNVFCMAYVFCFPQVQPMPRWSTC